MNAPENNTYVKESVLTPLEATCARVNQGTSWLMMVSLVKVSSYIESAP